MTATPQAPPVAASSDPEGAEVVLGSRERRCAVTREAVHEDALVRFAVSPDGVLTPDLAAKLPGRGVWVRADRASVETLVKKNLASRSAGRAVRAPADLAERVEALLVTRCLQALGLARRAGHVAIGFDKTRALARTRRPAYIVEAKDAAADGRKKVLGLVKAAWGDVPVVGCFSSEEMGHALGRAATMHAALEDGPHARRFSVDIGRLSGFRDVVPASWARDNS